ncbi:MAG: hypothetical protein A2Z93_13690 [Curvibacter sp. GWA2_64_110]|nr:MAG: hypothetical protein A2Z93_13690 [Curvibacter sp. GWA2_64_110]HCY17315.1 hypothetical protein [Curvibacter sp.]
MKRLLALLALALLLSGCGGMRLVDAQVQATATSTAIEKGGRYRFERLPSQAEQPRAAQVEAIAQVALAQVGLIRNDSAARYSALLGARVQPYSADYWGDPLGRPGGSYGQIMIGTGSAGSMVGWGMRFPPPTYYRYEVSLLLRDLPSGLVVYETRATHDGPWRDENNILPALFEAALKDFPHPPAGVRQVNIEIPR